MNANKHDVAQGQQPGSYPHPAEGEDSSPDTEEGSNANSVDIPRPLTAKRQHCLWCCCGSALEVNLCPAKSCPLWPYRFGKKPTADMLAEVGDIKIYPLEDAVTWAEFHKDGGTVLKAIKRRCLDCSGSSKSEARNCHVVACALHPFRLGKNPNRVMNSEQRTVAAARLKANIKRGKRRGHKRGKLDRD